VEVTSLYPKSEEERHMQIIKRRMIGEELTEEEISTLITCINQDQLNDIEVAGFLFSQQLHKMSVKEIVAMTRAMAETGNKIDFPGVVNDKHSIGGVPGNKVTLLIVPILAAAGLLIPKTCSRAITSPSGTADTMEVLAGVEFQSEELVEMVTKTNGIIVEANVDISPVDPKIIKVEHFLGINPESMMIASILAKKLSMGVDNLVLDIPTESIKVKNLEEGRRIARKMVRIGKDLQIQIEAGLTYGGQPVGDCIGPALEAREAITALKTKGAYADSLIEKSTALAGMLLDMNGKTPRGQGKALARSILTSGKAHSKMMEIIEVQGGNPKQSDEISVGPYKYELKTTKGGYITQVDNLKLNRIAITAGAPKDKGAGIEIGGKRGDKLKQGGLLLRIHAEKEKKLDRAVQMAKKITPILVHGMLLERITITESYTCSE